MTPNIPRPRSRGRLYLTSADPTVKPALDFRYFTDPEGYDAATLVYGIKAARRIAETEPFKGWIKREVAPGPKVQSDEDISYYARKVAHTVYHPSGTTRMGDVDSDELAVVDAKLKVRGLKKLRIADAGVFPTIPTIPSTPTKRPITFPHSLCPVAPSLLAPPSLPFLPHSPPLPPSLPSTSIPSPPSCRACLSRHRLLRPLARIDDAVRTHRRLGEVL